MHLSWNSDPIARFALRLLVAAGVLALSAACAQVARGDSFRAAVGRGSLIGVVRDSHEDAIAGARVLVLADDGEVLFETTTSSSTDGPIGEFKLDRIPAGRYGIVAVVDLSHARSRQLRIPITAWLDTRVRLHVDLGS